MPAVFLHAVPLHPAETKENVPSLLTYSVGQQFEPLVYGVASGRLLLSTSHYSCTDFFVFKLIDNLVGSLMGR